MSLSLHDLSQSLTQATSLVDCQSALQAYLSSVGIRTFSFTYYAYHPHSTNELKYDMCSENYKRWHQHYLTEQYNDLDSTLSEVYHSRLPIFWDIQTQLNQAACKRERQMRLDSIDFGVECGLSIPLHGPLHDFAILLLVQMRGETCLTSYKVMQYEFMSAALCYFQAIQKHLISGLSSEKKLGLSQREIQCIQLLANEFSLSEIAKSLSITERTVNFHFQNINKKMGTKSKYQSVTKALEQGILTL